MMRNSLILVGILQLVACSSGGSGGDTAVGGVQSTTTANTDGKGGSGGSKATSKTTKSSGGAENTTDEAGGSGGEDSSGGTTSATKTSGSKATTGGTKSSSGAAVGGKSGSVATGGKSGSVAAGGKSGTVAAGGSTSGDGGTSTGGTTASTTTTASGTEEWVPSWATTIQKTETKNLPTTAFAGNTVRQFVWPTLSGSKIRIQLSNERGNGPVEIKKVHIAMATGTDSTKSSGGIDAATDKEFLFNGAAAVNIPKGETVWSDELAFDLQEIKLTAITMQMGSTVPSDITGHPGARTTTYLTSGDAVNKASLSGGEAIERWYFINAIEIMAPSDVVAIAAFGDSITDGYKVQNAFQRWPDYLTLALKKDATLAKTRTVLNFGMGANNLTVSGAEQDSGLVRFERDVLKRDKVKYVVLLQGINDILYSNVQAQPIVDAYKKIMTQAKAKGIKVYGSPILPLVAPADLADPQKYTAAKDTIRKTVNASVRTGNIFDQVIDFEKLLGGAEDAATFLSQYAGDSPHPNIVGYEAMANLVDLSLFK